MDMLIVPAVTMTMGGPMLGMFVIANLITGLVYLAIGHHKLTSEERFSVQESLFIFTCGISHISMFTMWTFWPNMLFVVGSHVINAAVNVWTILIMWRVLRP